MLQGLADGELDLALEWPRVIGHVGVTILTLGLGGFTALVLGDVTQLRQGLAYGVAWQGTLGSMITGPDRNA